METKRESGRRPRTATRPEAGRPPCPGSRRQTTRSVTRGSHRPWVRTYTAPGRLWSQPIVSVSHSPRSASGRRPASPQKAEQTPAVPRASRGESLARSAVEKIFTNSQGTQSGRGSHVWELVVGSCRRPLSAPDRQQGNSHESCRRPPVTAPRHAAPLPRPGEADRRDLQSGLQVLLLPLEGSAPWSRRCTPWQWPCSGAAPCPGCSGGTVAAWSGTRS